MKIKWDLGSEKEIWRSICAPGRWFNSHGEAVTHPKSLYWFIRLAWGVDLYLNKHPEHASWFYDPIHAPYIDWLQTHLLRWQLYCHSGGTERYYLASVLPRGYGKTVCATKSAMIWLHLNEPDLSTLIASSNQSLAADIYDAMRIVLSGEDKESWFAWLYGNWKSGAKSWTKDSLEHGYRQSKNLSEPSFDVTSVDKGMTGYHHRIHVWDDPIYKNKLREGKEAYLRSVQDAVNASYNALQSNGLLMFVLTRYLDNDVAGRHFRDEGVASWSGMECPNTTMFDRVEIGKGVWHVYFYQTEDELTGEPTHPVLWSKEKIAQAKRRDAEDFASNQQNNPGTGERAPIIESQLPELFVDYKELNFTIPIEAASIHVDTAFKTLKTIRTGDDSAIVSWLHDARRNGIIYLDTDQLRCSNEWREQDFNSELIKIFLNYRRRVIRVKALTDEVEPGGKAETYRNRILSVLSMAGISLGNEQFKQFNRTTNKKARIRSATGYWAEGYVRILLHKDINGRWLIPPIVRKLFSQILRIDVIEHEDLADAATDVFTPGIWIKPINPSMVSSDEGENPYAPGDDFLKSMSRPMTNDELFKLMEENKEIQKTMGPGHGWTTDEEYDYSIQ